MGFYSAQDTAFRQLIRDFLSQHLPPDMAERNFRGFHATREDVLEWSRILARAGWSVPNWPKEHGGPGWTITQRHIFEEECFLAGAPPLSPQGQSLVGPMLYTFGNEDQKRRFLPGIISGEHFWAQGFSEPNSGSDLASLKTSAVREGDHYVVNGQKIWTSEAHYGGWLFLLVRTRFDGKPQAGISFLLVDLESPGITVRPIIGMEEAHSLNEVFLENVQVPVENLVGEENQGWTYAKSLLGDERVFSAMVSRCKKELHRLKDCAAKAPAGEHFLIDDPHFRRRIAELEVELIAHETTTWRVLEEEESGIASALPVSSLLKIKGTELLQAIEALAMEALGSWALPVFPEHDYLGPLGDDLPSPPHAVGIVSELMYRRASTIYGGTNEIQRNILAAQLLKA